MAYAIRLAELRSFRTTAEALRVSQPALTRSIQKLEVTLGVTLFDRLPAGAEPTAFGAAFLENARLILQGRDDLLRNMQLLAGLEIGTIRISAGAYPYDLHVPHIAGWLGTQNPGLSCRLRLGNWREVTAHVLSREADLGIAELSEAVNDERLSTEPVGRHAFYFYCRTDHPLLNERQITATRILSVPWASTRVPLRMASSFGTQRMKAGTIDAATKDFIPAWEVDAVSAAKQVVAGSDFISGALLSQIEPEVSNGTLAVLPLSEVWMHLNYGFITLQGRSLSPASRLFMEEFRRRDAELADREAVLRRRYSIAPAA